MRQLSRRALARVLSPERRRALRESARRWRLRAIEWTLTYTPRELQAALVDIGVRDGDALVMHSAFRPTNGFRGDPSHLIDAILDVIGPRGHLCMMSTPYVGSARDYLASGAVFDLRRTPSQMGVVTEAFRRRSGVRRSANPLHPLLALGPRADWLVEGHEALAHSCGPGSPFHKLLALDARALFFDVGVEFLTFTHLLEDRYEKSAPVPVYAADPMPIELIDAVGARHAVSVYPFSPEAMRSRNFSVLYDALTAEGKLRRTRVGNTTLQAFDLAALVGVGDRLVAGGGHIYTPGRLSVKPTPRRSLPALAARAREEVGRGRLTGGVSRVAARLVAPFSRWVQGLGEPDRATREADRDRSEPLPGDPGAEDALFAVAAWLSEAQDRSASKDGGVAEHFSMRSGWSSTSTEATALAVPALLWLAQRTSDSRLLARVRRMLDCLASHQRADGRVDDREPSNHWSAVVVTGLALRAFAAGTRVFDETRYAAAARQATRWLTARVAEPLAPPDAWTSSPNDIPGEALGHAAAAAGLLEATPWPAERTGHPAVRRLAESLAHQRANGWFGRACLSDPTQPSTIAIGLLARALLEGARVTGDQELTQAAARSLDPLLRVAGQAGFLPGRLRSDWTAAVTWSCPGGSALVAEGWCRLYALTRQEKYLRGATALSRLVRRTIAQDGPPEVRGGVKGSYPIDGGSPPFVFSASAVAAVIESTRWELEIRELANAPSGTRGADEEPGGSEPFSAGGWRPPLLEPRPTTGQA
jgi:aminoglycoside N3'-acetyltransferase